MKRRRARGARFASLERSLAHRRGVRDAGALAAWIGRRKYGRQGFARLARRRRRRR